MFARRNENLSLVTQLSCFILWALIFLYHLLYFLINYIVSSWLLCEDKGGDTVMWCHLMWVRMTTFLVVLSSFRNILKSFGINSLSLVIIALVFVLSFIFMSCELKINKMSFYHCLNVYRRTKIGDSLLWCSTGSSFGFLS